MSNLNGITDDWYYSIQKFNDWTMPDIGFPDRQLWSELVDVYPDSLWTRDKVSDIYRWYEIGIQRHNIPPYDIDTGRRLIFDWLINNTSYSAQQIREFEHIFKKGVREYWIDPEYVNAGSAPSKIVEIAGDVKDFTSSAASKTAVIVGSIAVIYGLFKLTPLLKRKKS